MLVQNKVMGELGVKEVEEAFHSVFRSGNSIPEDSFESDFQPNSI